MASPSENTPITFMTIPAEIRKVILEYILVSDADICTVGHRTNTSDLVGHFDGLNLDPSILRTCRRIHSEGIPILYSQNHFRVDETQLSFAACPANDGLNTWLTAIGSSADAIRQLSIPSDNHKLQQRASLDFSGNAYNRILTRLVPPFFRDLETMELRYTELTRDNTTPHRLSQHLHVHNLPNTLWPQNFSNTEATDAAFATLNAFCFKWVVLRAEQSLHTSGLKLLKNVFERVHTTTSGSQSRAVIFTKHSLGFLVAKRPPLGERGTCEFFTLVDIDPNKNLGRAKLEGASAKKDLNVPTAKHPLEYGSW